MADPKIENEARFDAFFRPGGLCDSELFFRMSGGSLPLHPFFLRRLEAIGICSGCSPENRFGPGGACEFLNLDIPSGLQHGPPAGKMQPRTMTGISTSERKQLWKRSTSLMFITF